jgi:hypothetical protein
LDIFYTSKKFANDVKNSGQFSGKSVLCAENEAAWPKKSLIINIFSAKSIILWKKIVGFFFIPLMGVGIFLLY